jgi:hypothetical protein
MILDKIIRRCMVGSNGRAKAGPYHHTYGPLKRAQDALAILLARGGALVRVKVGPASARPWGGVGLVRMQF